MPHNFITLPRQQLRRKIKRSRIEAAVAPHVDDWFVAQASVLWA